MRDLTRLEDGGRRRVRVHGAPDPDRLRAAGADAATLSRLLDGLRALDRSEPEPAVGTRWHGD